MEKTPRPVYPLPRRKFLKNLALASATALVAAPSAVVAASSSSEAGTAPTAKPPTPIDLIAETRAPAEMSPLTEGKSGSDFMVDVLKSLDIEYICANPGSSFRGIHESIINYGKNVMPELITCTHEENAVSMAHGFAKIEGKPIAVLLHSVVGVQHSAMAVYNAWCDRVPVFLMMGDAMFADKRRPGEWPHSAQDNGALLRDFLKWDDYPADLQSFAESAVRAYQLATTPSCGPVALALDIELQENPIADSPDTVNASSVNTPPSIPKLPHTIAAQGDSGAVDDTARLLVEAQNPVLVADRLARTPAGLERLTALAELLQAPVVDQGGCLNFPSRHRLNVTGRARNFIRQADVIVGLELRDYWGTINSFSDTIVRHSSPIIRPDAKTIAISARDFDIKSNYQDFQRFPDLDLDIYGDGEETLPSLIEAVKRRLTSSQRTALQLREQKIGDIHNQILGADRAEAVTAWDASPISTARMCAEVWGQIHNEDWSFVSAAVSFSNWPLRLWDMTKHYHFIGDWGGGGMGYGSGASVGAALANRKYGRLTVSIETDGDLMYSPGALWTAAHHRIPLLMLVHNNRAYHQEFMQVQRMTNRHSRGIDRAWIGTTLRDPFLNYAQLAKSMGVYSEGPVSDPNELGPAITRAIAVVKSGEPALIDVVSQPR